MARTASGRKTCRAWGLVAAALLAPSCGDDGDPGGAADEPESAAEAAIAGWPRLGRDLGHSRAAVDESTIDPGNVGTLEPAWELGDVDGVTGTPIVDGGTVYVGDWTGKLRALDAETGDELWASSIDGTRVQSAVALDQTRVFAGTFGAHFAALDRQTGEQMWDVQLSDHDFASVFGSPIQIDGLVIVGVGSYENMVVSGDEASFRGSIVALDAATGDERWRYWTTTGDENEGPGVGVWSTPAVDRERGHLYIGTGQHHRQPTSDRSDALLALDVATGEELWRHQFTEGDVWTLPDGGEDSDIGAPPNLFEVDGRDAVGAGDKAGFYKALDRETGEELWSRDLTEGSLQGGVMASAAVVDGRIFVASNRAGGDAVLFALDAGSGDILWRSDVGGGMQGPVTWANDVVFTADNSGAISGFDAGDGELLWSHEVPAQAAGGIAVVDGTVYAGYGWWLSAPPDDPEGGLIALQPGDAGPGGGNAGDAGSSGRSDGSSGEAVFQQSCATCHGADGTGGSGPDLTDAGQRLSPEELEQVVQEGRGAMPAWEGSLSPEEIAAVVDYVTTELAG